MYQVGINKGIKHTFAVMSTVQIVVTVMKHVSYKAVLLTQRKHRLFVGITERCIKADSHIACRSPANAVPLRVYNVSFPFDLHSAAVSDSHLPCRAHAKL